MYSEQKILMRLEASKKILGWIPERHSIEEVEVFTARMKQLEYNDPNHPSITRILRDPTPAETRFIRNEIQMCQCDADYFLTRYAWIKDPSNTPVRFRWRSSQRMFFRALQWMEEKGYSQEMMLLKARQQYMTTIVLLLMSHRIAFGYGINAVSASCDRTKSEEIATRLFFCLDRMPWWVKPTEARRHEGRYIQYANECSMTVQSGNQVSGIARGTTPTCVHLSEVADFIDPKDLIEASLFRAVHSHPKVFLMLESTGNSDVGWWAETWRKSKADWHRGMARLYPMFIPWFVNTELYPTPTWIKMHPVPAGWRPSQETFAHINKCRAYVRNTDYLTRELGKDWQLPRDQAWFWEFNYQEHKAKKIEREWLQEMPADDYEALQSRKEKAFPYDVLTRIADQRDRDYDTYAVIGEGIDEKFHPLDSDIDYTRPRIPIVWSAKGKVYRWFMVPLDVHDIENTDSKKWCNKLFVYHYPDTGKRYSVAIDTAGGGGLDRTVISVNEVGAGTVPDFQAAEFASDNINSAEVTPFVMAVCAWYDAHMTACEQIRKPGDTCQVQMRLMGWPNTRIHSMVRYDGKRIQKSKATKKGWYTHAWSRSLLLDMFLAAVCNGWYVVNSKFLVEECDRLEAFYSGDRVKLQHAEAEHDDRIFAAAISYFIVHDLEMMIERSKQRYAPPTGKKPELVLAPVNMNVVPFSQVAPNWHRLTGRSI